MNAVWWRHAPLAAAAAGVFALMVITGGGDAPPQPPPPEPQARTSPRADGDTAAETINTLIAEVEALDRSLRDLREKNSALRAEADAARARDLLDIKRQLSALENKVDAVGRPPPSASSQFAAPRFVEVGTLTPASLPVGDAAEAPTEEASRPIYTIAPNSIFFDATALTALVGRVPIDGEVRSPFPVKVLVGGDNVAAGGAPIPGLRGMLFSGSAVGDRTLRCVSVELRGATFIFEDGTIENFGDSSWTPGEASIGWLSDAAGLPCLPGALLSNAGRQIAQRVLLGAAEGYAGAGADSQLNRISTPDGGILESLSGDAFQFRRDSAWRSLAGEWARFIAERAADDFDAIYIPPGREVIVHVTSQLPINYVAGGRRLVHGEYKENDRDRVRLD